MNNNITKKNININTHSKPHNLYCGITLEALENFKDMEIREIVCEKTEAWFNKE